jgi:hypothetical protein
MRTWGVAAATACAAVLGLLGTASASPGNSAALLAKYAPVLELNSVDRTPSAIEPFLAGANLERASGGIWRLVRRSPPASALANGSDQLRLDTRGCSPATNTDSCYGRRATPPTIYGRVWTAPAATSGVAKVLQYWFFYTLDDWRNSLSKPTLWHMHEGDWEEASVALDASGRPLAVAASQHDLGVRRPWSRVKIRDGTHPVVWVALGSHANYLAPGFHGVAGAPHQIPPRFSGIPLPEPDFTSSETSVKSPAIVDLTAGRQPWLSFAGAWGDGSFILISRGVAGGTAYARIPVGSSPPGPAFHGIWRDPLSQFRDWPIDDGH